MSRQIAKRIGVCFLSLICLCSICLITLYLSYLIPTDAIKSNIRDSALIIAKEGSSPSVFRILIPTRLDNFTDTIMMFKSGFSNAAKPFESMMLVSSERFFDDPVSNFISFYLNNQPLNEIGEYARYWHGYLVFTKPLFFIFTYQNIRIILGILQLLIVIVISLLLKIKKRSRIIAPVILLYIFLNPLALSKSLQFSNMFFVSFISLLLVIVLENKLKKGNNLFIFFTIIGGLTSFFDLLTYPLLSFGLPLIYYLEFNKTDIKNMTFIFLRCMFYWFFGYIVLWAMKWILATLTTDLNVIEAALIKIQTRTIGDVNSGYKLPTPILALFNNLYLVKFHVFFMVCFSIKYLKNYKFNKNDFIYAIFMALPLLWWSVAANHSYIHSYFTYKLFGITYFAYCIFMCEKATKKLMSK